MAKAKKRSKNVAKTKPKHKKYKIKFEKKFIVMCCVVAALFVFLAAYMVLLNLDSLTIKTISVTGNAYYSYEEIVEALNVPEGQNILSYSLSEAKESIYTLPYINKIRIVRKFPSEIVVKVEEREVAYMAYVEDNNVYVLLDKNGVILSETTLNERGKEILIFGINFDDNIKYGECLTQLEKEKLDRFLRVYEVYMANNVGKDITSVTLSQSNVILTLNNELDIKISYASDLSYKISFLKSILKQVDGKTGSIDMTAEDPIYSVY